MNHALINSAFSTADGRLKARIKDDGYHPFIITEEIQTLKDNLARILTINPKFVKELAYRISRKVDDTNQNWHWGLAEYWAYLNGCRIPTDDELIQWLKENYG